MDAIEYRLIDPENPKRKWVITIAENGKVLALQDIDKNIKDSNLIKYNDKTKSI